jgi:single-strand DNA-binding protein
MRHLTVDKRILTYLSGCFTASSFAIDDVCSVVNKCRRQYVELKNKVMANEKNSVRLSGFAGTDPVIVDLSSSKRMARISLAVNEYYKDSAGAQVNQTQWFNLVFWNKKVLLIEDVVRKGMGFRVEGKLNTQRYTDKKGEQRFSTEIVVNSLEVIC